ncbi:MAG TPA: arginine--tRNA ligase [Candidatus Colwellbacteria bacterium]|nr:arginine--tRNA ligase [Candidatus Colwellbacteria bacterium]HQA95781.1 arginine--tRNA ligase [Candidatus Colwellbacteria bacterium]
MLEKIANLLSEAVKEDEVKVFIPENPDFGHYSTNLAFEFAKMREISPDEAGKEIRNKLTHAAPKGFFSRVDIAGGFLNFTLSDETLEKEINLILRQKQNYGRTRKGHKKTVVVDYSAPNIAKPMNVGHLRSTIIGQAIVNLLRFEGYRVIGDNHLGDWGTQFGGLLAAFKKWGSREELKRDPIDYLVKLYIRFNKEAETNEELMNEARMETAKLQKGDRENRRLWKEFVRASLKEFNKTYRRLGVRFSVVLGESFYQKMLPAVVKDALEKGVAKKDDGAIKIALGDEKMPDIVIEKTDGSHLYATTDLAAIVYRVRKWHPEKILYVVANEQALHFSQIFKAAEILKIAPQTELEHVKFGMLLGESGQKMSTRRGEFIKLEELLDRAKEEAGKIDQKSAEQVGIGAVKYFDLSHDRRSDIVFDWNKVLNLKGNSAPYILYTYARLRSVLRKAGPKIKKRLDLSLLRTEAEKKTVRQLVYFPDMVAAAAENYMPNYLADYLYKLANDLNAFYETSPVISVEKNLAESRLALVAAGSVVLKQGLKLLGIETLEQM